ncbi:MAG: hypothetical protein IT494_05370 [Gammaproteobacteria bacterium]|nr:hypothetical protein [Gammaproteobacteria bacterium]
MNKLVVAALVTCVAFADGALAVDTGNCKRPATKPEIPNAASATEAEMLAARNAVKSYNDEGQVYLECLKQLQAARPDAAQTDAAATVAKRQEDDTDALVDLYNGMVDDMHAVADSYNEAVRTYKARTKK